MKDRELHRILRFVAFSTRSPADRTNAFKIRVTFRVAKASIFFEVRSAFQGFTSSASIPILCARDSNVFHSHWTVRSTDAASKVMEARFAFRVPEKTIQFTVFTFIYVSNASAIVCLGFVAIGSSISKTA